MSTEVKLNQLDPTIYNNSMSRQAIINGNFDVWQRGTSSTLSDTVSNIIADRWYSYAADDGGTLPTLTISRQQQTAGDIAGSFYFYRLAPNGAGTSLGNASIGVFFQKIEYGTRFLAGLNKKVTVSFWARSSIANKKLGIRLRQEYGTGGSPTTAEIINGTYWTLTSTWTKYTATFTTNTLVGKTFGTDNNDVLRCEFGNQWGSSNATTFGDSGAETFVGSGNIDIAQVQLCAGDVALPFMPKSVAQEKLDCKRYCVDLTGGSAGDNIALGMANPVSTTHAWVEIILPVDMRDTPTLVAPTASNFALGYPGSVALTAIAIQESTPRSVLFDCTTASGLTANTIVHLYRPGTTEKLLLVNEL